MLTLPGKFPRSPSNAQFCLTLRQLRNRILND
nr:MAG TPA: hypothetical protein [Microviridae sp.]